MKESLLYVVLYGNRWLGDTTEANRFISILEKGGPLFLPEYVSICEPINHEFNRANLLKIWTESNDNYLGTGGIFYRSRKNRISGNINWAKDGNTSLLFSLSAKKIVEYEPSDHLLAIIKELFLFVGGVYGYGCHSSQLGIHYTPGFYFSKCLGGVTWMSIFGTQYVNMFGEKKLRNAPCLVEQFGDNSFMLRTSHKPCLPNEEILRCQAKLKEYLGFDAFCERGEDGLSVIDKKYRTPLQS